MLLVTVALVAVGGGIYIYQNTKVETGSEMRQPDKIQETNAQTQSDIIKQGLSSKTYNHPSGLYSISYPSNWTVDDVREGVVFSDLGKKEAVGYTENYTNLDHELGVYLVDKDPTIEARVLAEYSGRPYVEEEIRISGIDSKRLTYRETRAKSDVYSVPLSNGKFITISVLARDGSDEWLLQGYEVVQMMVVDQNKVASAESQRKEAQDDLALRNLLANIRPMAELYRDSHPDYTDFCDTREEPAHRTFLEIKQKLGNQPFRCTDGVSFAVSAKLYSGEYYCVDSKNFSGAISSLHTSTSCR